MFKLPQQIKDGLPDYDQAIKDFLAGKIAWARLSGIRVPWGNYSHRGGRVFMSRVRVPAGLLSPIQLKAIAHCSKAYGNGLLHITTRQDIQIHDVRIENIIKIHEHLSGYELSSRGGGGNTVRNITSCALSGVCAKEPFDTREDAVSLTEYLLTSDISYNLPRKLKIAFSGCGQDCAGCLVNDVGLLAVESEGRSGYKVYVGGGMGAKPALGQLLEEFILRQDLGYVATAVRNTFYKHGDRKNKHHNRLKFLIEDIGFDLFKEHYKKELAGLRENEYISLRKITFEYPRPNNAGLIQASDEEFKKFIDHNCFKQKQNGFVLVKLRIPRGDLTAEAAQELSALEKDFKGMEFRASHEQDLCVANIAAGNLYDFYSRIKSILEDFLYPSTLLDVVACKGSLTCNLGLCNSPALVKEIEAMIKGDFLKAKIFNKINLKVNGCPNACGQHPIGMVSLHGAVRKVHSKTVPFYRLFLGGRLGADKTQLAKDTGIMIPARNVPLFLKDFLNSIESRIDERTDIHKFINEEALSLAQEAADKYSYVPPLSENRDFYVDWGRAEEFSLEGLGPGECGAGVLDMIDSDLTEAKIALKEAEEKEYAQAQLKKALFLSSRALLVVKGIDPRNEEEAFNGFIRKFVEEGIADAAYKDLKETYESIGADLKTEQRKERFLYAKDFLHHVQELYEKMDPTFNFPKQQDVAAKQEEKVANTLDLKGTPCPINYVKAKLFLENLNSGDKAEIFLDEGEPIANVPKSLQGDGHQVLAIEKQDGFYRVVVKKG